MTISILQDAQVAQPAKCVTRLYLARYIALHCIKLDSVCASSHLRCQPVWLVAASRLAERLVLCLQICNLSGQKGRRKSFSIQRYQFVDAGFTVGLVVHMSVGSAE
jgi:hypothetical protein